MDCNMQNTQQNNNLENIDLLLIDANIATMDPTRDTPYGIIKNACLLYTSPSPRD